MIHSESHRHTHDDDYDIFPANLNHRPTEQAKVAQHMLRSQRYGDNTHSASLTEQLQVVEDTSPDVVFFTMNSAIPIADALRGWKEIARTPTPTLAPIMANRAIAYTNAQRMAVADTIHSADSWLAMAQQPNHPIAAATDALQHQQERLLNTDYAIFDLTKRPAITEDTERRNRDNDQLVRQQTELQEQLRTAEIERLRSRYMGAKAIVIDQYTATGQTLKTAVQMLGQAGITAIEHASQTHLWYSQYLRLDRDNPLDYQAMTTEYRDFMNKLGRTAAKMALAQTY